MKPFKIAATAAVAALLVSACATPTPYQPLGTSSTNGGGYSEQPLEQNRFNVSFRGNSLTDRRTVETYLLYRAAELTVQQGYDWFTIVDKQTDRNTRVYADPDPFYYNTWGFGGYWGPSWRLYSPRYGGWGPWGAWGRWGGGYGPGWGPGWGGGFDYRQVTSYEAHAEIFMGRGEKPADDRRAFSAREVIERVGPAVVRPT